MATFNSFGMTPSYKDLIIILLRGTEMHWSYTISKAIHRNHNFSEILVLIFHFLWISWRKKQRNVEL